MAISDDEKRGAEIVHGKQIAQKSVELLEEFGLPTGLLPLEDCIECGIVRSTGFLWIICASSTEHYFELLGRKVSFGKEITARLAGGTITCIRGIKARELMLWLDVSEIQRLDEDNIRFRGAIAGMTRTFPAKAFARILR